MSSVQVIPVIHYLSDGLARDNAELAFSAGADGVFLIDMAGRNDGLVACASSIKRDWPARKVGINFLGWGAARAIEQSAGAGLDMTWSDNAQTHSQQDLVEARKIQAVLARFPGHEFFGGVAFKYQKPEPNPALAALRAAQHGMIPCTSGPGTGFPVDVEKLQAMRSALGDHALAVASGVTPDNVAQFLPFLSHILVATGISKNEHELDFELACQLIANVRRHFQS